MVSKEVTRKEEALEHHRASVHHGMLLWVLHLVCVQLSNCKTTFNGSLLSTYSVMTTCIYSMKELVSLQPTLHREILPENIGVGSGCQLNWNFSKSKPPPKIVCFIQPRFHATHPG